MATDSFGVDENAGADMAATIAPVPFPAFQTYRPQLQTLPAVPDTATAVTLPDQNAQITALNAAGSRFSGVLDTGMSQLPNPNAGLAVATEGRNAIIEGQRQLEAIKAAREAEIQRRDQAFIRTLGSNDFSSSNNILNIAAALKAQAQDIMVRDQALGQKMQVGFFDNPIQYIMNQFTIPHEAAILRNEEAQYDTRSSLLDSYVKMTDDAHKQNSMAVETDFAGIAKAQNLINFGLQRAALADSIEKAAQLNIGVINARDSMSSQQFQIVKAINDATNQSTQNSIQFANYQLHLRDQTIQENQAELQRVKFLEEQNAQQRTAALQELQYQISSQNIEDQKALQAKLQTVSRAFGMNTPTVPEFKLMPTAEKEFWLQAMSNPEVINSGRFGYDVLNSVEFLEKYPNVLPGGSQYMREQLRHVYDQAVTTLGGPITIQTLVAKDKTAAHQKIVNEMMRTLNIQAANIPDSGSVFSPDPLGATVGMKALAGNAVVQNMQQLAQRNPDGAFKAQDVMASALQLVNTQKISMDQAVTLVVDAYQHIVPVINQRDMPQRFAMGGLNSTTGYRTSLATGLFGGREVVDLTNPAAVQAALVKMGINQSRGASAMQGVTEGFASGAVGQ